MRNSRDTGIWSKGQNNKNKNEYKNNYLRDRSTLELSKHFVDLCFGHFQNFVLRAIPVYSKFIES
jgi:hypothetical protein